MGTSNFSGPVASEGGFILGTSDSTKTATATAGAATLNTLSGVVTSEALTTAAAANYTLTITNSAVTANDIAFASIANGTNSQGTPHIVTVTPGSGSLVIVIRNDHATLALNGTLKVSYAVFKVA